MCPRLWFKLSTCDRITQDGVCTGPLILETTMEWLRCCVCSFSSYPHCLSSSSYKGPVSCSVPLRCLCFFSWAWALIGTELAWCCSVSDNSWLIGESQRVSIDVKTPIFSNVCCTVQRPVALDSTLFGRLLPGWLRIFTHVTHMQIYVDFGTFWGHYRDLQ